MSSRSVSTTAGDASKADISAAIAALRSKDGEIVETYVLLTTAMLDVGTHPAELLQSIADHELLPPIELDVDVMRQALPSAQATRVGKLLECYQEFRASCMSAAEALSDGNAVPRELVRRLSQNVLSLMRVIELMKDSLWERYAHTDQLTGLLDRNALEYLLPAELSRAERLAQPLCLAIIDIDNFKQINDRHGHDAGDHILTEVADRLMRSVRAHDHLFRIGGDEILLLLPNTHEEDASFLLDRARAVVAQQPFPVPGGRFLSLTISVGFSRHQAAHPGERTRRAADKALYEVKASGRNAIRYRAANAAIDDLSPVQPR